MHQPGIPATGGKRKSDPVAEKYFTVKELLYAFILVNFFIVFILITTITIGKYIKKTEHGKISDGQLIISDIKDGFIPLDGDWNFEWYPEIPEKTDESLIPDYFSGKETVPGYWKSGGSGLGIYRLNINHGKQVKNTGY